jgi:hypothetical protein
VTRPTLETASLNKAMTAEQVEEVKRLAAELHDAQRIADAFGLTNTAGLAEGEARQLSVDYAVALARVTRLRGWLEEASKFRK